MTHIVDLERLDRCYSIARSALLDELGSQGHWTGELSTSALSTATAVMAFELTRRAIVDDVPGASVVVADGQTLNEIETLIDRGVSWLAEHQNSDGGWGDTVKSVSNISTTMLVHAVFHATNSVSRYAVQVDSANQYIDDAGGVPAVLKRYGKDRTFSIPILTHCALAALADWKDVIPLPFELSCLPASLYRALRLPVVSYALPALIAIGQVRHHFLKPRNPLSRLIRDATKNHGLRVLTGLQPSNGGFLEAAPLTSFVTMSLVAMGHLDHQVTRKGLGFLRHSVLDDGSWPIDTNLATWVTTLSINALRDGLPDTHQTALREWLLGQQYREVHPYTQARPGGWAWTDLPGGVPDTDDTPGAILALMNLRGRTETVSQDEVAALTLSTQWLLGLQNSDGGWPTFCRGWGTQPFDRSAPDLTAHVLRAFDRWLNDASSSAAPPRMKRRVARSIQRGLRYLAKAQRPDGTWLPLWFGNQHAPNDENPTYGTARVLAAYRDVGLMTSPPALAGATALANSQNDDGGWSGVRGLTSSIEETALAVDALMPRYNDGSPGTPPSTTQMSIDKTVASTRPKPTDIANTEQLARGLQWLTDRVEDGRYCETSPIGFYFAKLWYFERLYPLVFTVAALGRAKTTLQ